MTLPQFALWTRVPWMALAALACYQQPTASEPEQELRAVVSTPAEATLQPQGSQRFLAYAVTVAGDTTAVEVTWAATAGAIDETGAYRAPGEAGDYLVVATHATKTWFADTSRVTVVAPPPPDAPVAVAGVDVTPGSLNLSVGSSSQLTATPRDSAGNALDRPVSWATTNPAVATADSSGLVRGVAAGSATITATSEGKTGSAAIAVTSTPAAVDSVTVTPGAASLNVGDTVRLVATALDAAGNVLGGRSATWSSGNTTVASVTDGGLVTANAPGSAVISASVDGVSGTAAVSVLAASGDLADECGSPQPGWVWCDDFDQDRLDAYFEYDSASGGFVRESGVGNEGSTAMRARFRTGQVSAGALHLAIGRTPLSYFRPADDGTADYTELYWRVYVRNQPGWIGGGGRKLSRAFIFASPDWAQAMVAHVWAGGPPNQNYLFIEPVSGTDASGNLITTKYNDLDNFEWLGPRRGATPLFDSENVGRWHCVEARVKLNDSGVANGIFQLWVNGELDVQRTDLNFVDTYAGYGLNAVYLENYWNEGSPQEQERYLDNFVVSTEPIGCK